MPKKPLFIILFLLLANAVSWYFVFFGHKDYLQVSFFDVGQGDAIFIETAQGHQILIDGGPDNTVLEKLEEEMGFNDKTIDMVILTHPDKDHFGGLVGVLQTYHIDNFVWTGEEKDSDNFRKLKEEIGKVNAFNLGTGDSIIAGDIALKVLNPDYGYADLDSNDTSIVLRLKHFDASFMLTGDLTSKLEVKLIKENDLRSDILKLGHHGSKHSSSDIFLKAVSPKYAVAMAGEGNSFGHPNEEVLERLEENDIELLRTDRDGDITFYSNGSMILFKREKP